MRYYQEGDQIFIFGCSRGAYTARVVAGMLHKVGLLTQGNEELIPFAWDTYQNQRDETISDGLKSTFCRPVRVHFLGLWDTVSSVGWAWAPQHLPYTQNNPSVDTIRHAAALDERRVYFVQNLWGTIPVDVEQVWFPGVHCNVGGGYPEDVAGLSAIALKWMIGKAEAAGLIVDPVMKATLLPAQNTPGSRYAAPFAGSPPRESLTGLWWLVEFIPKTYKDPAANFATKWMIAAAGPLSRNSLTTAIWPSRWSRLPPFPAATMRGVLPFASGPSTLAHGPARTAHLPGGVIFKQHLLDGAGQACLADAIHGRSGLPRA
jgi:hypothetical protein